MVQQQRSSQDTALKPSGGSLIFIGGIATPISTTIQHISAYVASKAAVRWLVKHLAIERAVRGIPVNSLLPGYTMTDIIRGPRPSSQSW